MNERLRIVAQYCVERRLRYELADDLTLVFGVEESNGDLLCVAEVNADRFILHAIYPLTVPSQKRHALTYFAARANHRTEIGMLTLDDEHGEIGLKTGVAGDILEIGPAGFAPMADRHLRTANQWLAGVALICFTGMSPTAALRFAAEPRLLATIMDQANEAMAAERQQEDGTI